MKLLKAKLKPVKGEREDRFDMREVAKINANQIATGEMAKKTGDAESEAFLHKALLGIDDLLDQISEKRTKMIKAEKDLSEETKIVGGKIRQNAERIAQSFDRFEKTVNLEQLNSRANDIERIANALEKIATLHDSGKLEAIGSMLKK